MSESAFVRRHVGLDEVSRRHMLDLLGRASQEELVDAAVPDAIRTVRTLDLPPAAAEHEVQRVLAELGGRNAPGIPLIGLGYSRTITPAVIRRNVLEDPSWYTAYTPYQPEISQGRLEALLVFQTAIADLTALPVAGASLLDEATAVAEAVALAHRTTTGSDVVLVDPRLLPQSLAVLRTRMGALGLRVAVADEDLADGIAEQRPFAVVIQVPGANGDLRSPAELRALADRTHEAGGLLVAACDLLALALLEPPGEWGADIAVGSSQRFGVPLFYGGPHAAYIAVRAGLERHLPGRLVGVSLDADGVTAFRLALQTREQHIRREKATSNICTSQVLLAVTAAMYAVYHGPEGLRAIATRIHDQARGLAAALVDAGHRLEGTAFFDTLVVETPGRARELLGVARRLGFHLRLVDEHRLGISLGEGLSDADLAALAGVFDATYEPERHLGSLAGHDRPLDYLTHPVFSAYHSETALMRYLRTLSDRDFALDRGMIPLGSCTLKLNPAAALETISYAGFADLHPFVPAEDAEGYRVLVDSLETWLAEITGYDRVSVQPNAGSQGEYAGLLAVRAYHDANGQGARRVCLIPASAHGTNAASAALAGLRVVVVATAPDGSVDLEDLRQKVAQHADELAVVMVTYPSTHGVFEETIGPLCDLVHAAGGQVYVDGANLNALVGLARLGEMGADVSHLNLHKTFAIPHGGGGPGVGPVGVRAHLAPYLPGHPLGGPGMREEGAVSAAPYGSPGILPISYAYIAMMGPDGLRQATLDALLSANYVAARLAPSYPILYTGRDGLVAHECILDLRPLTKTIGVTVDDVAKRLIDYGFHAPTMSFPVPGTLMVEPTESEDLVEIDRFCDAMIAIRGEMDRLAAGEWPADDNPLRNAPHPLARVTADAWDHPYSRTLAAFPAGRHRGPVEGVGGDKYWPACGRIDGAYGDRNLVCACPPVEAYSS